MAKNQENNHSSPAISRQIRQIKEEFSHHILPGLKRRAFFKSRGEKRREKKGKRSLSFRKPVVIFSPFAQILEGGLVSAEPSRKSQPVQPLIASSQSSQIVSVFIIAVFKTNPAVFLLQKIQKKSAPGFPSGRIENGETILQAAAREFKEESGSKESAGGIDIMPYNPLCIGKFILNKATHGERGAVVVVEIPESEIVNLETGGGGQEEEVVEELLLWTFEEVLKRAQEGTILPNSVKAWNLYLDYLINTP